MSDEIGGGDAADVGGGMLIGVDDELSLPLLEEEAAATTCWEDAMVVMQHNSNENLGQNRAESRARVHPIQKRLKKVNRCLCTRIVFVYFGAPIWSEDEVCPLNVCKQN